MGEISDKGEAVAHQARQSDWVDRAARVGLVAYGVVHLVVAWLALQLALGERSGSASGQGAVRELAQQPFGAVLVWAVAVGMFLLACFRLVEAAAGHRDDDGFARVRHRLSSAGRAVAYGYLSWAALDAATGSGSSGGGTDSTTARVMSLPAGQLLVGAVGAVIAGLGIALISKAWTERFAEEMSAAGLRGTSGTVYVWLGKLGCIAKGVAYGIVGGLFGYAAVTHDPEKSGGLDQALAEVLRQPFGPYLLVAIALGIGAYGVFCLVQARYFDR